jgi:hypothetical protein
MTIDQKVINVDIMMFEKDFEHMYKKDNFGFGLLWTAKDGSHAYLSKYLQNGVYRMHTKIVYK